MTGKEILYLSELYQTKKLAGDGSFTKRCHEWMQNRCNSKKVLLTHSCTAALEIAAIMLELQPGDEVIMPSNTFVSTANAFVLRGAIPVFIDVRRDTLNLDESRIEAAITPKTRAIVPVHYAGVSCEMDEIMSIATKHDLLVVEDAAQGFMSQYKGRTLGSIGDFGAYSFHETKNIISGEGGALLINRPNFILRAEITREKGTDRSRFLRGEVDKYTWQEIGSSYLPAEAVAAFLWAQLEEADRITSERISLWNRYHNLLAPLEKEGIIGRPTIPDGCTHNGHMYYITLAQHLDRPQVLNYLKNQGISAVFHYVPLHSSPAGRRFGRAQGELNVTNEISEKLIRLPLWIGLTEEQQVHVVRCIKEAIYGT